jgi:hypothetical protein
MVEAASELDLAKVREYCGALRQESDDFRAKARHFDHMARMREKEARKLEREFGITYD